MYITQKLEVKAEPGLKARHFDMECSYLKGCFNSYAKHYLKLYLFKQINVGKQNCGFSQ